MNRPYVICHMMTSLDGRIDCPMTEHLPGVEEYYHTLDLLNAPSMITGRVTAELEMALKGKFEGGKTPVGKECFSKKEDMDGYDIIFDTLGTLLWPTSDQADKPLLLVMSEKASEEYLSYLEKQNISYIVTGKEKINFTRALEILYQEFHLKRVSVVGGAKINSAFLEKGLLDEISVLIGAGIDARKGLPTLFDFRKEEINVLPLQLMKVESFPSGGVWIRYQVKK